jgi:N-acetylgalactosamine-N,N'-diacetylbacillosaminyl-diphospho-undecaprenol 4-alpha-N-acetylgalactosaminyltransferase
MSGSSRGARAIAASAAIPRRGAAERRRVLFVINSLEGGGAERVMATLLANSGDRLRRHHVCLALLDDRPRAFALPPDLEVVQLDCKGATRASIAALGALAARFDPDITVSFLTRSNLATGLVMMKRRRPWIISERTSTPAHLASALRQAGTRAMMRIVYPRASRVIAVSRGVAAKLSSGFGVPGARIDIVPNPVDLEAVRNAALDAGPPIEPPFVIALGRLVRVKNHALLLRAFARSGVPGKLVIAGSGPEEDAILGLARKLGIADRLVLPGWLSNPYPALAAARLFALSSEVEGFPNALVEALALGIPAVATDCPDGPAEILCRRDSGTLAGMAIADAGILVPPGDEAMFARALQLGFEPPLREEMATAGPSLAADFSAPKIAARYWSIIEVELERDAAAAAGRASAAGRHSA